LVGFGPEGGVAFGNALVRCKTNVDVAYEPSAGFTAHKRLLFPEIWKQGSLIEFPTLHRQASVLYGAAIELAKHDPFSMEAFAGWFATKAITWVDGCVCDVVVGVPTLLFAGEKAKNCPMPKRTTSPRTKITITLLVVLFITAKGT
jgi:hypothetical protein